MVDDKPLIDYKIIDLDDYMMDKILKTLKRTKHRSEEHTSELQSRLHLVCRLLLEKKKKKHKSNTEVTRISTPHKASFSTIKTLRGDK